MFFPFLPPAQQEPGRLRQGGSHLNNPISFLITLLPLQYAVWTYRTMSDMNIWQYLGFMKTINIWLHKMWGKFLFKGVYLHRGLGLATVVLIRSVAKNNLLGCSFHEHSFNFVMTTQGQLSVQVSSWLQCKGTFIYQSILPWPHRCCLEACGVDAVLERHVWLTAIAG